MAGGWTAEDDDMLRQLRGKCLSFAEIAAAMPWRSRNACIGRAMRLGLASVLPEALKEKRARYRELRARGKAPPATPKAAATPKSVVGGHHRKFSRLPSYPRPHAERVPPPVYQPVGNPTRYGDMAPEQCRNIIGDEPDVFDRMVCGNPAVPGSSYKFCSDCAARMLTSAPKRNVPNPRRERVEFIAEAAE